MTGETYGFGYRYTDEHGHDHGICRCGSDCSTHPDASAPLDCCADCGATTCHDCREYISNAPICVDCLQARAEAENQAADRALDEAVARVLDRMGSRPETWPEAAEAVYGDYGGAEFLERLLAEGGHSLADSKKDGGR
jgi:hypothetical protein